MMATMARRRFLKFLDKLSRWRRRAVKLVSESLDLSAKPLDKCTFVRYTIHKKARSLPERARFA